MPTNLAVQADVMRSGYLFGYFSKSDIEKWADRIIEYSDVPEIAVIDLSMNREISPYDLEKLLRSLGQSDRKDVIDTEIGFMGVLLSRHFLSVEQVIRGLYALVRVPAITDEQRSTIYHLDDGYDLAIAGLYGTMNDVDRDLKLFVTPYSERLRVQFPELIETTV